MAQTPRLPSSPVLLFRRFVRFAPSLPNLRVLSATSVYTVPQERRGTSSVRSSATAHSRPASREHRLGHTPPSDHTAKALRDARTNTASQFLGNEKGRRQHESPLSSRARHILRPPLPRTSQRRPSLAHARTRSLLNTTYWVLLNCRDSPIVL